MSSKYQPTQEEIEGIELREDSVQDLMSKPPGTMLRWGTFLVLIIMSVLFGIGWWVQYPDLVRAELLLTTPQPPIDVVARSSGNLTKLLVKDGENVTLGQRLAVLHSVADVDLVFELQQDLKSIEALQPDTLLLLSWAMNRPLGELQGSYSDFMQHLDDYRLFLEKQTELQQIPFLKNEIEYYGKLSEQLGIKDSILADEIGLAEKKSARMREAKSFGGVSADEVEQAEATVLQQKRTKRDLNLQRLEYQIRINNLQKQIGDIRQRTQETAQSRYLLLKEFYQRLRAAVDTWLSAYIVTSPIAGEVAFLQLWSERQYVKEGTALMSIIPKGEGLIGRLTLPVQGSGKVELGQKVNVELLAFPRHEYGMLQGKVEKISLLPQNNSLIVEISLPSGMKTNYKKQLSFRPNMQGRAEIITKPRRLLQRLLDLMFAGRT